MKTVAGVVFAGFAAGVSAESPVTRVVDLIKSLKSEIESDGQAEQKTYDKFACWCEDTTARKSAAIDKAREDIESLSKKIVELKGTIGTLKVDISQLNKDIAENIKSQEEATAMRQKEHSTYAAFRVETEQATAALKKAIEVLAGAGTGKSSSALQQAQTLSVIAGVKSALKQLPKDSMDDESLEVMQKFVANPIGSSSSNAFLQAGNTNNPFGDYAPASTKIQGILKDMYDTFTSNLQTANEEEGVKQKAFEELMDTKKEELAALKVTLANKTATIGEKTKELADAKAQRSNTESQLKEDEAFFADTKEACSSKADEWAERTRLRTEELGGIAQALKTLDSPEARAIFESSATTFVQLTTSSIKLGKALTTVKALATKSHSLRLASLAVTIKSKLGAGRDAFAEILGEIEKMIQNLRQEEQDDIDHRDFCEQSKSGLSGENDSLAHTKENTEAKKDRLKAKSSELQTSIENATTAKEEQEAELEEALNTRNEEHSEYIQALKDDKGAVALLSKAIEQMAAFYKNNKIAFIQQPGSDPTAVDEDKAPETFGDKAYGGRKSESTGVFAILEMIKEDIEKEIGESQKNEAEATAEYEKMRAAGRKTVNTLVDSINQLSLNKSQTDKKVANLEGDISDLEGMINGNEGEQTAMKENCDWIETSFESRRTKRIAEVNGLQTAKSFLNGAEATL